MTNATSFTTELGGFYTFSPVNLGPKATKRDGTAFFEIANTTFPAPSPETVNINMMPFIMGIKDTLPENLHRYWDMIMQCELNKGDVVYLTVRERSLQEGQTQSRTGIHTDGTVARDAFGKAKNMPWGGSPWGGGAAQPKEQLPTGQGIFIASNDGRCLVWDCQTWAVNDHGAVNATVLQELSDTPCIETKPSTIYWISDRTPHMALPSKAGIRQFFRLVGPNIGGWWEDHSTPNPIGIKPNAPILKGSKFKKGN